MGYEDEGFLSGEMSQWCEAKKAKHPEHFKQVIEINTSLQSTLLLTGTLKTTIDNFLVAGLYLRAVQSYQGSILMAERGMITEAITLNRSTTETLFYLRAARVHPEFKKEFSQYHIRSVNKVVRSHINVLEQNASSPEIDPGHVEGLEDALAFMNEQGVEPGDLKIFRVAQMAGMEWLYKTDYAMYSTIAHPSVVALEQNWDKPDPMGMPVGVRWGPNKGEPDVLPETLLEIAQTGIYLLREMHEQFPDQGIEERIELHKSLQMKLLDEVSPRRP